MPDTKEQISSQELYNWLFEACNIMRGPINQDEYKSYTRRCCSISASRITGTKRIKDFSVDRRENLEVAA